MTNNMNTLSMSIKGSMLHVTLALAEVTAQRKPLHELLMKMLLVLTMFIIIAAKEPVCCIWQCARVGQVGPR